MSENFRSAVRDIAISAGKDFLDAQGLPGKLARRAIESFVDDKLKTVEKNPGPRKSANRRRAAKAATKKAKAGNSTTSHNGINIMSSTKGTNRLRKRGLRSDNREAKSGTIVTAPATESLVINPTLGVQSKVRTTFRQYFANIGSVAGTSLVFTNVASLGALTPNSSLVNLTTEYLGGSIDGLSNVYAIYRFLRFRFVYVPLVPSSTTGYLSFGWSPSAFPATSATIPTVNQIAAYSGSFSAPVWSSRTLDITPMLDSAWRFTQVSSSAPISEARESSFGAMMLNGVVISGTSTYGQMWVEGEAEFDDFGLVSSLVTVDESKSRIARLQRQIDRLTEITVPDCPAPKLLEAKRGLNSVEPGLSSIFEETGEHKLADPNLKIDCKSPECEASSENPSPSPPIILRSRQESLRSTTPAGASLARLVELSDSGKAEDLKEALRELAKMSVSS